MKEQLKNLYTSPPTKRILIFTIFFLGILISNKTIAGNDPCSATPMSTVSDAFHFFDNTLNSNSGIVPPPYGNYTGPDTWLSFTMPAGGELYLIVEAGTMIDPALALYSGLCTDPQLLYNIVDHTCTGEGAPSILFTNLTPGETYYLRIWAENGTPNGNFSIYLNQSEASIPGFDAFADAIDLGDCIQLTSENTGMQGCAWYQIPIDFGEPFTHTMTANFGDLDGNGADGITLVYQSNGPSFCGGTGEGIGAQGMPNSAIFEFDTWQNGNLNDPAEDHCAFNINGNMNHNASINGPVTLGNIEDGLDHQIEFSWNPVGSLYELYFDGSLVLSGSFDIVNNCFGGQTMVYWGYTASTGGYFNNHVICPEYVEYEFMTLEYQEATICEDENYLGYTQSGFYVADLPGGQGCAHQVNIDLTVNQNSIPTEINATICKGDYVIVDNQAFYDEGFYSIFALNSFNCDSLIYLDLEIIDGELEIAVDGELDCHDTSVTLIPNLTLDPDILIEGYLWSGPESGNSETLEVNTAGTYELMAIISQDGVSCTVSQTIDIEEDTESPIIQNVDNAVIDCDSSNLIEFLNADVLDPDGLSLQWYYQDSLVSNVDSVPILGPGLYLLEATNYSNGCTSIDSGYVSLSNEHPEIELFADTLNCKDSTLILQSVASQDIISFTWMLEGDIIDTTETPTVESPGLYSVIVINDKGCKSTAEVEIVTDQILPEVVTEYSPIGCDEESTTLTLHCSPSFDVEWTGPEANIYSDSNLVVSEVGTYIYTITNPENYCSIVDSIIVTSLGSSPMIDVSPQTINCEDKSVVLEAHVDDSEISLDWYLSNNLLGTGVTLETDIGGQYLVTATSITGCTSDFYVDVNVDTLQPLLSLTADTINCLNNGTLIEASFDPSHTIRWSWNTGTQVNGEVLSVDEGGKYIVEVMNETNKCSIEDSIWVIDIRNFPEFSLQPDTLTCDNPTASPRLIIHSDVEEIVWTGPQGFSSEIINPSLSLGGAYTLTLVGDGDCVVDTTFFIQEDISPPEYTLEYDSITCDNPTGQIEIIPQGPDLDVSMITPSGLELSTVSLTTEEEGFFFIQLTGSNGCSVQDSFQLLAFLELPQATIEQEGTIDCNSQSASLIVEAADNLQFEWIGPSGEHSQSKDLEVTTAGEYQLSIVNTYGCSNTFLVNVADSIIYPTVQAFGTDIDCNTAEATLHFETTDEYIDAQWKGNHGLESSQTSFQTSEAGIYSISIQNRHGCIVSDSIEIAKNTDPPEITSSLPTEIFILLDGSNRSLPIDVVSEGGYDITWYPSNGLSCDDCQEPTLLENSGIEYTVEVVNEYGCSATLSFLIGYEKQIHVNLPNIFSPHNGDGINDYFTVISNENIELVSSLQIFDRWGQLVFSNFDFPPNMEELGWNGTLNGQPVSPGVYVYQTSVLTTEGEVLNFIGDVTVVE